MRMWNFEQFSENVALIDETGTPITYLELLNCEEDIKQMCHRCMVAVLCRNSIGSVVGYVAFVNNRIVPMLLNVNLEQELLNNLLDTYKPSYVWCPLDAIEQHDILRNKEIVYQAYDYCLIKMLYDKKYELYDELALLLTTSGSTGSPKFVRQSYKNIKSNTESIIEYLSIDDKERPITTLPMNYTYGLSIINTHLMIGATVLLTEKSIMQKEFWQFFKEQKASSFGGVPYTYEMLDRLRFYRMDLPSLRTLTQAGGKITPELHAKFAEYAKLNNKKFIVMYGQCEATARMGYLPAEMAIEKCGAMGIVIPGGNFSLIDVEDNEINEADVPGELVYRGDNVTLGYAECGEDLAKSDERNGVLRTGDVAKRDKDGFYYIVGRLKRFLKIYGNRVNLDEIDQMIKAEFEEIDVASTGIDDHMYVFVTKSDAESDIRGFLSKKTKLNPSAFNVKIINEIPKNDSGKILYKKLLELI